MNAIVRNSRGNPLAKIESDEFGNLLVKRGNKVVGRYLKEENATLDERGEKIGDGDCIEQLLGYGYFYVYVLVDPLENNKPFYVGKGTVNRAIAHMRDAERSQKDFLHQEVENRVGLDPAGVPDFDKKSESKKNEKVVYLKSKGFSDQDIVRVVCRRVSSDVALAVESCLIKSVYGLEKLTNRVLGHHPERFRASGNYEWMEGIDLVKEPEGRFVPDDGNHKYGRHYVYVLIDPRKGDDRVFYVGKGTGGRVLQHIRDAETGHKGPRHKTIRDILKAGYSETEIARIVARVSSEHVAFMLESLYVNFIVGCENLDNAQGGHESGLFRAKGDWALRQGFDIPIVVKKGQPRVELLDQFLGQGLDLMLYRVRDVLCNGRDFFGLEFSPPTVRDAGELVIDTLVDNKVYLRIQTRSPVTGTFNTILEPRDKKQKEWIIDHFNKLGKSTHLWKKRLWFNCKSWSHRNLTTDVEEAARRARLLVKLVRVEKIGDLPLEEQKELFPD